MEHEDGWKLREGGKRRKTRRVESWPILGRSTGRYTEPTVNHASVAIGLNFLRLRVPKPNSYAGNNCLWNEGTWPQGRDSPGIPRFLGRNVSALSNHRDLEDSGAIIGDVFAVYRTIKSRFSLFGRRYFARQEIATFYTNSTNSRRSSPTIHLEKDRTIVKMILIRTFSRRVARFSFLLRRSKKTFGEPLVESDIECGVYRSWIGGSTRRHIFCERHTLLLGLSTLRRDSECPEAVFSPTFHTRRCENI